MLWKNNSPGKNNYFRFSIAEFIWENNSTQQENSIYYDRDNSAKDSR
jgi:hypothetical protein